MHSIDHPAFLLGHLHGLPYSVSSGFGSHSKRSLEHSLQKHQMKAQNSFILSILALCIGCQNTQSNANDPELDLTGNGQKISFVIIPDSVKFSREGGGGGGGPRGKPKELFINEHLPPTFTKRKIMRVGGTSYNIFLLPGNIVKYNENDSTYSVVTIKSLLKNQEMPKTTHLHDAILYSNKINNKASFNGSALIGSLSVSAEQLMELIIQDAATSIAEDIDYDAFNRIVTKIPQNKKKDYFFIKTALLTVVNSRVVC
jgi:hypothetical protein